MQLSQRIECRAYAEIDEWRQTGAVDVCCGSLGVLWVELERDEDAVGREGAGEADGAVSAQGSDFEDSFGALHSGEQMEKFALSGAYVDGRKFGAGVRFEGFCELLIGWKELFNVAID